MSPDAPAGVLHDLGFRHYDGPREGRAAVARALALDGLRGAFGLGRSTRSKVMPVLLLAVSLVPALVVAVLVNLTDADELPVEYVQYPLVLNPVITLFVAGQAPAAVSRDLRSRVVSLYFSRPLTRTHYVRAKYAGLAGALLLLLAAPLLVLFAGALLAQLPWRDQAVGLLQGLLTAALLAAVLAGLGLLIASVTPRRGVGVAAVVAVLVMLQAVQGALQGLGQAQDLPGLAQYSRLASPFGAVEGVVARLSDADTGTGLADPSGLQALVCLAAVVLTALTAYLLLLVRYRRVQVS